jgi:hypothetical protein
VSPENSSGSRQSKAAAAASSPSASDEAVFGWPERNKPWTTIAVSWVQTEPQ